MQLHLLILNSVLARSSFQPCSNSVYKGSSQTSYCQKQSALNNHEVTQQFVIQTSQVSNVFVGVGQVQNSRISMQVEVPKPLSPLRSVSSATFRYRTPTSLLCLPARTHLDWQSNQ
ncbi:Hypothetical_protein [Hexamita inflata]|uniref:Hypothetical_protein n=1 Tax=Hexamita inflata TaxID=28002 RepID=A0AA86U3A3_9EUKA|nr:Hypothetical protein HINF_LOCUS11277 [Hexamita inflata]CAI9938919.1 Hypothetical protein HINF_LOCUS26564 [Hexamita inflata]